MTSWKHPKWTWGFLWVHNRSLQSPSASFTEIVEPLPNVPTSKLHNPMPNSTITSHPHLFKIVTPVKVDRFEQLLSSHPNQPLVQSVCRGLCEGFWPFACFSIDAPDTWDNSTRTLEGPNLDFALSQRDEEIEAGRFSSSFGTELLPGMYSMPIGVVPKPHSTALRLITDHSASDHVLNSFITRTDSSIKLDNLQHFGTILRTVLAKHGRPPA